MNETKFKHVGTVTDESYWQAWEENDVLECLKALLEDVKEAAMKKYGWMREEEIA